MKTRQIIRVCTGTLMAVLFLVPFLNSQAPLVDVPNVVDPSKTEILSLRLYMSGQEAAEAIRARFHDRLVEASPNAMCPLNQPKGCMQSAYSRYSKGKKYISQIHYHNAAEAVDLVLNFVERYPFDPAQPEVLTSISYSPKLTTEADRQAFFQKAKDKYGPSTEQSITGATWCTKAVAINNMGQHYFFCDTSRVPALIAGPTGVNLSDPTVGSKYYQRWNAEKTVSTPPL